MPRLQQAPPEFLGLILQTWIFGASHSGGVNGDIAHVAHRDLFCGLRDMPVYFGHQKGHHLRWHSPARKRPAHRDHHCLLPSCDFSLQFLFRDINVMDFADVQF